MLLTSTQPACAGGQTGYATWYSQSLPGAPMVCGVYNPNALTAAHPTLPCGTKVLVTRTDSHRSVLVTINDRGPSVPGQVIELSQAAMDRLGGIDDGVIHVRIDWGRR